jgi:hypothetical protein
MAFVSRQRRAIEQMQQKRKAKDVRKYGRAPKYTEEERELIEWMATPAGEAWLEELLYFE